MKKEKITIDVDGNTDGLKGLEIKIFPQPLNQIEVARLVMKSLLVDTEAPLHGRGCECGDCEVYKEIRDWQKEKYLAITGEEYTED